MWFLYCNVVVLLLSSRSLLNWTYGFEFANKCEVCKILAEELEHRLRDAGDGKTSEYLEIAADAPRNENKKSALRLFQSSDRLCEKLLDEYNARKDRINSTRFATETSRTLHGLVDKDDGIGMPNALWNKVKKNRPSIETLIMRAQCEYLLKTYESDIQEWYFNHQTVKLTVYLCKDRALKSSDASCLDESLLSKGRVKQEL